MASLNYFLPEILNELYSETSPDSCCVNSFDDSLFKSDIVQRRLLYFPLHLRYIKPGNIGKFNWVNSTAQQNKKYFKFDLNVRQFKPEEISVKIAGNYIVIEAKHDEREDEFGLVARQFTRRLEISSCINKYSLTSTLSSDGILTLTGINKESQSPEHIVIPVSQTNEPAPIGNEISESKTQH